MEKYITKTAPNESDPRVNFNPDLWQRDIFDAIDARVGLFPKFYIF